MQVSKELKKLNKENKVNLVIDQEVKIKLKKQEIKVESFVIKSSKDTFDYARKIYDIDGDIDIRESVYVIFLKRNNQTIGWFECSKGGIVGTVIDNRLILASAITCLASSMIIIHNHPSGETKPSQSDIDITRKLNELSRLMNITVLDHVICTSDNEKYYSFADEGINF